jgi:hypothetical protein
MPGAAADRVVSPMLKSPVRVFFADVARVSWVHAINAAESLRNHRRCF